MLESTYEMSESEAIYETLRKEIVLLKIQPGTRLSEIKLAKRFGVSRAPIRVALRKLSDNALIEIKPQKGSFVTTISSEKVANIKEVRFLLEPYAAKIAAPLFTDADLKYLTLHFDRLNEANNDSNQRRFLIDEVDEVLHDLILSRCGNPELAAIVQSFRPFVSRVSLANLSLNPERELNVVKEMRQIFDALIARDGERAFKEMQHHLEKIKTKH
jgi:DNA-binding GntR family transcriptional regulator